MKVAVPAILAATLLLAATPPGAVSAKDLGVRGAICWRRSRRGSSRWSA